MTTDEEILARALHEELRARFRTTPGIQLALAGAGVNWQCIARREGRRSETSCFATFGAQYLTSFEPNEGAQVWGRTRVLKEAIAAVATWMEGASLAELYARHAFVDGR